MPRSTADRTAVALCLAAVAYCACATSFKLHRVSIDIAAVSRADPVEPDLSGAGFARNKLYTYTVVPPFTGAVKLYGSWAKPVPSAGSTHTAWYKPVPHFAIFFAGYPNHLRNHLFVEVQTAKAGIIRLPVPPELIPGEAWWLKNFALPEDQQPIRFRIGAVAVPLDSQGWLGFSEPFVIRSVDNLEVCKQLLLIFLAAAGAVIAFLSPGLMLRQRRRRLHFIWIPFPGIVLLTCIGLAAWLGPAHLSPRLICRVGLFFLIGYAAYHSIRCPLSTYTTRTERGTLFIFLVLVSIAGAKSIYSPGPAGELYAGRVSRTLEPGWRSDSRVSYHIVQLAQLRESPFGSFAALLYYPWNFSHRGPIPSLALSPLVLSARVNIPRAMPDQAWSPFDPEGFALYRIGMIVLACCGLLTVFGLARMFLPEDWALFAFLVAATAPFTIHEIYFTWPKLAAAGFALLAAYLVFRGRYLFAGLVIGFGYLVHPSALMSVPALAGIIILQKRVLRLGTMAAGVAAWLLFWRYLNRGHYAQGFFLEYFRMTAGGPATLIGWLQSRFYSVVNTLIPLYLFFLDPNSTETRSAYGPSPPVIRFFFQYWNTLPFGAGIAFFLLGLLRLFYFGYRKVRAWFFALFVIPFVLFVPYWGWGRGGLLREALHAWFLGLMIFAVIIWYRFLRRSDLFFRLCNWALLFRGIETLCVLVVPTLVSQHALVQPPFVLSDAIALFTMAAATLGLYLYVFRWAEKLRAPQSYSKNQESTGLFQRPNRSFSAGI